MSAGQDKTTVVRNSRQLWLPVNIPTWRMMEDEGGDELRSDGGCSSVSMILLLVDK